MQKPRENTEIYVSVGMTINLGDYESARIDAGITVPIGPHGSEDKAFEHGWKRVLTQVRSKAKAIRKNPDNPQE